MDKYDLIAELFKNLSNPLRIKILYALGKKNTTVCNLAQIINENQPQVSRALSLLKDAGLLICERKGNKVCYKLSSYKIIDILNSANEIIKQQSYNIFQILKKEK